MKFFDDPYATNEEYALLYSHLICRKTVTGLT